jgi:hypothetical protein
MMQHDHNQLNPPEPKSFWSKTNIAFIGFLAIAGFYLFTEHRAHLFGYLPIILLLACPLLHLFMHGGHGHGGNDDKRQLPPGTDSGSHH